MSEQTAREMAEGAAKQAHAGCAVATTGVAGPGGGTLKTPVGRVVLWRSASSAERRPFIRI